MPAALGLAMGVGCRDHQASFNSACDRLMEMARRLVHAARSDPGADTYVGRLLLGFEGNGSLDEQDLLDLIVITVFGGVDTTKSQLGSAIAASRRTSGAVGGNSSRPGPGFRLH